MRFQIENKYNMLKKKKHISMTGQNHNIVLQRTGKCYNIPFFFLFFFSKLHLQNDQARCG